MTGPVHNVVRLGIKTTADGANRLAVRRAAPLLTHEGAGHQTKLSAAIAAETASLVVQTGWSGLAEIGTASNDALSVRVSANGRAWLTALVVLPDGRIGLAGVMAPAVAL
jgi:hypothetical protein